MRRKRKFILDFLRSLIKQRGNMKGGKAMRRSPSFMMDNIRMDCPDLLQMVVDRVGIELIECSRQPGKLKITKKACGRRYLLANRTEYKKHYGDFRMAKQWSLAICKSCTEGYKNAEVLPQTPPAPGRPRF
jgi:hypothetical protein